MGTTSPVIEAPGLVEPSAVSSWVVRRWHWMALVAIVLVAAGLRVHDLTRDGFWIDELHSLQFSGGYGYGSLKIPTDVLVRDGPRLTRLEGAPPAWRVWTTLADDSNPPLYYVAIRLWRDCFGSSDAGMRAFSVAASLVAIVLTFDVGRLLFTPGAALWASSLMAVAETQILYAREARGYMLLTVAGLVAIDALLRVERSGWSRARGAWLFVGVLAMPLTHYFSAAGCVALGVYACLRLSGATRRRTLGVMAVAAVAYGVAWGPFLVEQTRGFSVTDVWQLDQWGPGFHTRWLRRLMLQTMTYFCRPATSTEPVAMAATVLLVLPFALVLRGRRELLLPALYAAVWVAFVAALDLGRHTVHLLFIRYTMAVAPAVFLLAAGMLAGHRVRWMRHAVPASLVLYCVLSRTWASGGDKAEWRRFGRDYGRLVRTGDLVLFDDHPDGRWFPGIMYLAADHYSPEARPGIIFAMGPSEAAERAAAAVRAAQGRVWVAYSATAAAPHVLREYAAGFPAFSLGVGFLAPLLPVDGAGAATRAAAPRGPG